MRVTKTVTGSFLAVGQFLGWTAVRSVPRRFRCSVGRAWISPTSTSDFLGLLEDLEGTKWLIGDHWVFPRCRSR